MYGLELGISFTNATETSITAVKNFMNANATRNWEHESENFYSGDFRKFDDKYRYGYYVNISVGSSGYIALERWERCFCEDCMDEYRSGSCDRNRNSENRVFNPRKR
jgi:hypothetical protein